MRKIGRHKPECSKCGNLKEPNRVGKQAYCSSCQAAYMRATRPKHRELTELQRMKANARSYANVYIKRGLIKRETKCSECGKEGAQMHHDDYSRPTEIKWLCRPCHLLLHRHTGVGSEAN